MNELIRSLGDDLYRMAGVEVEHHEEQVAGLRASPSSGEANGSGYSPETHPATLRRGRASPSSGEANGSGYSPDPAYEK